MRVVNTSEYMEFWEEKYQNTLKKYKITENDAEMLFCVYSHPLKFYQKDNEYRESKVIVAIQSGIDAVFNLAEYLNIDINGNEMVEFIETFFMSKVIPATAIFDDVNTGVMPTYLVEDDGIYYFVLDGRDDGNGFEVQQIHSTYKELYNDITEYKHSEFVKIIDECDKIPSKITIKKNKAALIWLKSY